MAGECKRVRRTLSILTVAAGLALAGCSTGEIETHGNRVDPDALAEVVPGRSDRTQVELLIGSPSSRSNFDDGTWYYISRRTRSFAFFETETLEQNVIFVSFDDTGVVDAIGTLDKEDGSEIEIVNRETPTAGQRITLIQQLIGNIGRFTPDE